MQINEINFLLHILILKTVRMFDINIYGLCAKNNFLESC
jgi:hypothetical protein